MNTTSSGAVGFTPVGAFVKDLASELSKSATTLVSYLRKHLPTALDKRKNANNRLANWTTAEGEEALRSHFKPTTDVQKLEARVKELEAENASLRELLSATPSETVEDLRQKQERFTERLRVVSEGFVECTKEQEPIIEELAEMLKFSFGAVKNQMQEKWREANDDSERQIRRSTRNGVGRGTEEKSNVVSFGRRVPTDIQSSQKPTNDV